MPVILISRGTMSGVNLLVQRLAERTGYRCVAREDLVSRVNGAHGALAQHLVGELGNPAQAYEQLCDRRRPYVILMREALLALARSDNLIYHGYSGHLLLPPIKHFIRVRISAPRHLRIEMTMRRLQCCEDDAKKHITRDDEQRVRWARFVYGRDLRDPSLYDLCVNLESMSIATVGNLVHTVQDDPDCQATPASQEQVVRLLLATRVEAALATDQRTADIELGAEADDAGDVTITGQYLNETRQSAVLEIAGTVPGVQQVKYRYGVAPTFGASD